MNKPINSCCFVAVFVASWISSSFAQETSNQDYYDVPICTVHLIKDIDVPARESGVLKVLHVDQNDPIVAETEIAKIDDQVAQRMLEQATHKLELATLKASDPTEIEAAEKKLILASDEFTRNNKLYKKGSKTLQEAQRSLYSKQIAELELTAAKNAMILAQIEKETEMVNVNAARDSIARHEVPAPIDGYVLKRMKEAGEWVNAGEPIFRVGPLDRLHVRGQVDGADYDPYEIDGRPVTVYLKRARNQMIEFQGKIVLTGMERSAGTHYIVWAEVENRHPASSDKHWMLQPKSKVSMRIHLDGRSGTLGKK